MQLSQLNVIKTSTRQWTLFVSLYNKIMDAESNKIPYTVKAPQKAVPKRSKAMNSPMSPVSFEKLAEQ